MTIFGPFEIIRAIKFYLIIASERKNYGNKNVYYGNRIHGEL